ncbi:Baseplate J-like protein [compost metagenome]
MKPIPTISELKETISNDLKSKLNLSTDVLKKTLDAFASVISAIMKTVYLYLANIQDNVFPDTADLEVNGGTLERIGRIQLGRNPRPATVGVFEISVIGVAGSVLKSGLTFKSNENAKNPGQMYISDVEYIMTGSNDVIEIRSLGSGATFDLNIDDNLTITQPVLGVNQTVTVSAIVEQPKASESIDVYRQNILDSIQLEPQGGAKTDYRLWSADAQGVRKVYPYVKDGNAGVVQVFVEATIEDSTDGKGTPSGALLTEVESVIEFDPDVTKPTNERGRKPIQAILEVEPISLIPIDVTITGLSQDTTAIRDSISSNLSSYLYDVRPYISGADLPRDKNDILYESRLQNVLTGVLSASNFFTGFEMRVDGNIETSYTFALDNIPFLNSVTYN